MLLVNKGGEDRVLDVDADKRVDRWRRCCFVRRVQELVGFDAAGRNVGPPDEELAWGGCGSKRESRWSGGRVGRRGVTSIALAGSTAGSTAVTDVHEGHRRLRQRHCDGGCTHPLHRALIITADRQLGFYPQRSECGCRRVRMPEAAMTSSEKRPSAESGGSRLPHRGVADGLRRPP